MQWKLEKKRSKDVLAIKVTGNGRQEEELYLDIVIGKRKKRNGVQVFIAYKLTRYYLTNCSVRHSWSADTVILL